MIIPHGATELALKMVLRLRHNRHSSTFDDQRALIAQAIKETDARDNLDEDGYITILEHLVRAFEIEHPPISGALKARNG